MEQVNQKEFITLLPKNDVEIRAYALLQLIVKAETAPTPAYRPEIEITKRNIAEWKNEYYSLIQQHTDIP